MEHAAAVEQQVTMALLLPVVGRRLLPPDKEPAHALEIASPRSNVSACKAAVLEPGGLMWSQAQKPCLLCSCGNGASLHLSLQDGVIHLHHLAERDGASLLHHGLSPELHPQLLVRFVLDVQIAFEITWQVLFFHGDNFAYNVHSFLTQAQTLQDRKIGLGHWKNLVHLHTTGMRWCHGMELRSAIAFAEVCIKMSIVWILLL